MNPIRPSGPAPTPQASPAQRPDAARTAGQRAFFDMIAGKAAASAPAAQAAPTHVAAAPPQRTPQAGAEPPAKILRPGSLLDIRV